MQDSAHEKEGPISKLTPIPPGMVKLPNHARVIQIACGLHHSGNLDCIDNHTGPLMTLELHSCADCRWRCIYVRQQQPRTTRFRRFNSPQHTKFSIFACRILRHNGCSGEPSHRRYDKRGRGHDLGLIFCKYFLRNFALIGSHAVLFFYRKGSSVVAVLSRTRFYPVISPGTQYLVS